MIDSQKVLYSKGNNDECTTPPCKQGAPCHEPAPRGSQTGTQGIRGSKDRARIPKLLCEHIVDICEKGFENTNEDN